jgi:integrase
MKKVAIYIYGELTEWYNTCGLVELSKGVHLSKVFKKALRSIGASEDKHFHSLRHTFAVRRIVENVPIYKIKKMMGHSSVTTTEIYAEMELKRLSHDFPTLSPFVPKNGKVDTELVDTTTVISSFFEEKVLN